MGIGGMDSDDEDESSLLAELAALEGKSVSPKKAKPKKGSNFETRSMKATISKKPSIFYFLSIRI